MDFSRPKRFTARKKSRLNAGRNEDDYPHNLQFYSVPPKDTITLQMFEELALERLKVLQTVETIGIRHIKGTEDYKNAMRKELGEIVKRAEKMRGLLKTYKQEMEDKDYNMRRNDHISHFILRLAYCRSEELRRWFITQEVDLFRYRFCEESTGSTNKFMEVNNMQYKPIPEAEKKAIVGKLVASTSKKSGLLVDSMDFYKVPFTDVLDLVRSRKVYISKGYAYVPHNDLVVIVLSHFRSHLSHSLAVTSRAVPHMEEDNRLLPMLSNLSKRYMGQDYSNKKQTNTGEIKAEMIDGLSKSSFPLCMQHLQQAIKQDHHLKHGGRMQYGLFLKGIGLSLEEAMRFWKTEFCKAVDGDKFDKQYAYGIRHNYGKEGKRANYTPYSCVKIITTCAPGPGDNHGCPFKHTDVDLLRQKIKALQIDQKGTDEIIGYVKKGHYQLACGKFFEASHKLPADETMFSPNHPNQYFEESQKYRQGIKTAVPVKSGGVVRVSSSQLSQSVSQSQSQTQSNDTTVKDGFDDDLDEYMMGVEDESFK